MATVSALLANPGYALRPSCLCGSWRDPHVKPSPMSRRTRPTELYRASVPRSHCLVLGFRAGGRFLTSIRLETVIERLETDAQDLGGLAFDMSAVRKRGHGHAPLHFLQRSTDPDGDRRAIVRLGSRVCYGNVELNDVVGHDVGALHVVLQLTHVSRPGMLIQP